MRLESCVISLSWIPSEAITSPAVKMPFELGLAHYDEVPPDHIDDLSALREAERFRFANELRAWIDVEDERIVGHGYSGSGHMVHTRLTLRKKHLLFQPTAFPELRAEPEVRGDRVRFVQTAGGRTGLPAPRRVRRAPYIQLAAPTCWTTLALEIAADGSSTYEVMGASEFPRHWIYDRNGDLAHKTGIIDFRTWYRESFGDRSPWDDVESPALIKAVETALEREMSRSIMSGGSKPELRKVKAGTTLVRQGDPGDELFLLLDGVLSVDVDGEHVTELGPGAIVGELAVLGSGKRTSSLTAVTPARVAVARRDQIDRAALEELAAGRERLPES
ncbi:MAG: cyclic nucleotide-binding domain-containing protein [Actinomycetota bacterium]|nr:cyclic nucleotide-binding domain-containing protein [Actinomycetota bacterium]